MKAKRYRAPRNQAERLAEALRSIARLESTLRVGGNCFGEYGKNCRDSIKRWHATADDARAKLAREAACTT